MANGKDFLFSRIQIQKLGLHTGRGRVSCNKAAQRSQALMLTIHNDNSIQSIQILGRIIELPRDHTSLIRKLLGPHISQFLLFN